MAKSASGPKTLDLAELLHQATTLHQRGQIADAERCYRQILNVRRDHAEARHFLGILRFQQGRGAEALELIGAALKNKPDYAEAYYNRGNILAELGRFADALADYEQALALDSDYVEAHQNRGNVLLRLGRDAAWRATVKARIAANKHRLYGDRACIAALEDFLGREIWAATR